MMRSPFRSLAVAVLPVLPLLAAPGLAAAQGTPPPAAAPAAAPAPKPAAPPTAPPAAGKPGAPPAAPAAAAPSAAKPAAAPAAPAAAAPAATKPVAAPAPAAAAAAPPAPVAPTPPPELDALFKPYDGSWRCDTKFPAGSMGPGSPEMTMKTNLKIKKDLGNFWYRGEYDGKKSKTFPGIKGVFYLGYDAVAKQATLLGVDSFGTWSTATAPGATGSVVALNGEAMMMGRKMKTRETLELKGPKEAYHKYEVDMGQGLQLMAEDSCKK
jgi:hypothetical protein